LDVTRECMRAGGGGESRVNGGRDVEGDQLGYGTGELGGFGGGNVAVVCQYANSRRRVLFWLPCLPFFDICLGKGEGAQTEEDIRRAHVSD
jgi:hypothetical protein